MRTLNTKEPSEFGEINISLPVPAVSRQASKEAKQKITDLVQYFTQPLEYLLDDEVTVDIEWMLHERNRWETDASADMDNIVKPLLDALCGPKGILVDDCQVRSFSSTWINWTKQVDCVDIRIKYDADHFVEKRDLVFVQIYGAMCYPVPAQVREIKPALPLWLDMLQAGFKNREEISKITNGSYYPARYLVKRGCFHRSRVKGFPVFSRGELLARS